MASEVIEVYLYIDLLEKSLRNFNLSFKYLLPLLPAPPPRLVQGVRLQISIHHRHLYALRDQRFRGVRLPFQQDLLQVVGLRLRRLYQVIGQGRLAPAERRLEQAFVRAR